MQSPGDNEVRVLVAISSSGEDPYLRIEREGQVKTFAVAGESTEYIWIEGASDYPLRSFKSFLNRLLGLLQLLPHQSPLVLTQFGFPARPWGRARHCSELARVSHSTPSRRYISINYARFFQRKFFRENSLLKICSFFGKTLFGGEKSIRWSREENRFQLNVPNLYFFMTLKMAGKLRIIKEEFNPDFVLFTTSTCYVNEKALLSLLKLMPRERFYGGTILKVDGIRFAAGNNILMSNDVLTALTQHSGELRLDLPDDLAIGHVIASADIATPVSFPAFNLPFPPEESPGEPWESVLKHHVIRCKASQPTDLAGPVISRLREVHNAAGG